MSLQPYPTWFSSGGGRITLDKSNLDESNPPEFEAFDVLRPRGPPDEGIVLPMFVFTHALSQKFTTVCHSKSFFSRNTSCKFLSIER